jgi:hypothetical protein
MTSKSSEQQYWIICSIFLAANLIVSTINHIDDTDETYGYYEPLHYLLYKVGMQTWEYAPQYAIRTYSFITPFWIFGSFLKFLNVQKLFVFYGIRMLLGCFGAISEGFYVVTIYENYGVEIGRYTLLFLLCSSGVLYCSTALLPSAVIMSIMMVSSSLWIRRQYIATIFLGCVAVLWSGWPFVGILFIPFGLHMLWDTYYNTDKNDNIIEQEVTKNVEDKMEISNRERFEGMQNVVILCFQGLFILMLAAGSAIAVDYFMYNRKTFPTWNILVYNALGEDNGLLSISDFEFLFFLISFCMPFWLVWRIVFVTLLVLI